MKDGTWKEVVQTASTHANHPEVIIAAWKPDDTLWFEALRLGALEVIALPFDSRELYHAVASAWRRHTEAHLCRQRGNVPPGVSGARIALLFP